jgi:hypothetical protein
MIRQALIVAAFFSASLVAHAQEVIDVLRHEKIEATDGASAQNDLMNLAIEQASFESIKSIIGEEKVERSREIIKNKIIKNSGRYVSSISGQNMTQQGSEFLMDVQLKLSLKALRALLLENGLLYQLDGPPKVLPLIQMVDRVGAQSFGWWYNSGAKEHGYLVDSLELFQKSLKDEFLKIGFFELSPATGRFIQSLPEMYRTENLQRGDTLFISELFKSSVVAKGQIVFRAKPGSDSIFVIDVKIEALQSSNGRLMAEVVRTYETQAGAYQKVVSQKFREIAPRLSEDLSAQLSEAWKKGTFGASVVRLTVETSMSPRDLEEFKKAIVIQVRDIKGLRERVIESHRSTYEIDSSVLPQQLAQDIRAAKLTRFKVQVQQVSNEGVTLKVDAL